MGLLTLAIFAATSFSAAVAGIAASMVIDAQAANAKNLAALDGASNFLVKKFNDDFAILRFCDFAILPKYHIHMIFD